MTSLPYAFPRTNEWLERRLDLRARLQLRSALRDLERAADARLVVLWSVESNVVTQVVELAGDDDAMPSPLPMLVASVPSRDVTRDRHREEHDTITHKIRMGGDVPTLGIGIVAPGLGDATSLFDGIEQAAANAEDVIIKSVERAERERQRAARDDERRVQRARAGRA